MRSRRDIPAPDPVPGRTELIEAAFVEMDPICDGFCGVLVELSREPDTSGEAYVALAVSALAGERVVRFGSAREERARKFYEALLGGKGGGVRRNDGTTGT